MGQFLAEILQAPFLDQQLTALRLETPAAHAAAFQLLLMSLPEQLQQQLQLIFPVFADDTCSTQDGARSRLQLLMHDMVPNQDQWGCLQQHMY